MELTQNLWERYGFTGNPYDTKALSLSKAAPLSVQEAYVERTAPATASQLLTNFLRSPGGGRIVVEGDPGVGKTTFVNYHRQRWEVSAQHKLLSPVSEISVCEGWTERDLLLNLLASVSARLRLDLGTKEFEKDKLLREITAITGVRLEEGGGFSGNLTILGSGGGLGRTSTTSVKVGEITRDHLREYLRGLVALVKKRGFAGVIFHLDNLELLARQGHGNLRHFFDNVRDVLQEPAVYFIFVSYTGMFQHVIVPQPRVRSIFFDTPVHLDPLSTAQVREVMELRYHLLAVPKKQWIKPVEDAVVAHLYETFAGKIRYVMNAITSLISHLPDSFANPLTLVEATTVLREIQRSEIQRSVTGAEAGVFHEAVQLGRFTNSSLGSKTKKSKQQIQKYLRRWLESSFVSQAEKTGRNQFYEVEPRFSVLRDPPIQQQI
jgi:Cdc6-like AAA superfamily ATPase